MHRAHRDTLGLDQRQLQEKLRIDRVDVGDIPHRPGVDPNPDAVVVPIPFQTVQPAGDQRQLLLISGQHALSLHLIRVRQHVQRILSHQSASLFISRTPSGTPDGSIFSLQNSLLL